MSDAGAIGKEIQSTSEKLERLAKRARATGCLGSLPRSPAALTSAPQAIRCSHLLPPHAATDDVAALYVYSGPAPLAF